MIILCVMVPLLTMNTIVTDALVTLAQIFNLCYASYHFQIRYCFARLKIETNYSLLIRPLCTSNYQLTVVFVFSVERGKSIPVHARSVIFGYHFFIYFSLFRLMLIFAVF